MDPWFTAAGAASAATLTIHVFLGGPSVAAPLLAAKDLEPVAKYVNYYCWHLVTICLGVMAIAFFWAGAAANAWEVGVIATVMAGGFALWGLLVVIQKQQRYREMPQGWLFLPITVAGIVGVFA